MPSVLIPSNLRRHCEGKSAVAVSAGSVGEALSALVTQYPAPEEAR